MQVKGCLPFTLGAVMVMFVSLLVLPLHMQSVPITTKIVSSNPTQARCIRYNIM